MPTEGISLNMIHTMVEVIILNKWYEISIIILKKLWNHIDFSSHCFSSPTKKFCWTFSIYTSCPKKPKAACKDGGDVKSCQDGRTLAPRNTCYVHCRRIGSRCEREIFVCFFLGGERIFMDSFLEKMRFFMDSFPETVRFLWIAYLRKLESPKNGETIHTCWGFFFGGEDFLGYIASLEKNEVISLQKVGKWWTSFIKRLFCRGIFLKPFGLQNFQTKPFWIARSLGVAPWDGKKPGP